MVLWYEDSCWGRCKLSWCVQDKRKPKKNLLSSQRKRNRRQSSVRARVEHIFRVIKQQFGFVKTRYRGLAKKMASSKHADGTGEHLYVAKKVGFLRDNVSLP